MLERFFYIRSIKGKLTAVMMAVTGSVLLLVTLVFVVNEALTFRMAIHRELQTLANIVGLNTTAAIMSGDRKSAEATLAGFSTRPNLKAVFIITPDGAVFAEYVPPETTEEQRVLIAGDKPQQLKENLTSLAELDQDAQQVWEWDWDLEVVERVMLDNQEIGIIVIQSDLKELFARLKWFFVLVLLITVAALGVAFFLSGQMHRPISDPILDLAKTMKRVSEGREYGIRAEKKTGYEIGQLIDGFNDMLGQIQKRDENLEHFAAELKASNEELKAFIYSAAHDLRQPLVNIKGFTQETIRSLRDIQAIIHRNLERFPENDRDRIAALIEDDIQEATGFVGSSVDQMAALINALLKLSQIGYRELRPEPIDMKSLLRTVMNNLAHLVREHGIAVTIRDVPDVIADRTAMEQIMANLLDNAVKYLEKGRPGLVEITGERLEGETVYHVRDNGRGISNDDMPKLFNIFRRLGTQDRPGGGVGLAYVRALVRRQGGRIWCESEPGRGSVFSFTVLQRRAEDR